MSQVLDESLEAKQQYAEILAKTNEIYLKRKLDVTYEGLCSNVSFSDTSDIADTVKVIIDYIAKNTFELVIMGIERAFCFKWAHFWEFVSWRA